MRAARRSRTGLISRPTAARASSPVGWRYTGGRVSPAHAVARRSSGSWWGSGGLLFVRSASLSKSELSPIWAYAIISKVTGTDQTRGGEYKLNSSVRPRSHQRPTTVKPLPCLYPTSDHFSITVTHTNTSSRSTVFNPIDVLLSSYLLKAAKRE